MDRELKSILDLISDGKHVDRPLPGKGRLFLEPNLPFIVIYRRFRESADPGTLRLVRSTASYIIVGEGQEESCSNLVKAISETLSARFNSFLAIELWSGDSDLEGFVVHAPENSLPNSLKVLQSELEKIDHRKIGHGLTTKIKTDKHRTPKHFKPLLDDRDEMEGRAIVVGLEVPPIYRDDDNRLFPIFFRKFRNAFSEAVQKSIFEFTRIQTNSGIPSYHALGKREIHDEVFKLDRGLTEIESSYEFLLLVAPVNIQQIRKTFFESSYEKLPEYHYRQLGVDPDLLKRKLFNLRIDEIDDPALSYLYNEKREELDRQLTMLRERGTRDFFYSSIHLYKGVGPALREAAHEILGNLPEREESLGSDLVDSEEFSKMARMEFEFFSQQDNNYKGKLHIRDDVHIIMVSQGELYIPSDYKMTPKEAKALVQHELGTHSLTYFNGTRQPLTQLASGLADYDPLQEGLAVMSEFMIGGLTANRLRILAGRVVAGDALMQGAGFHEIFDLLLNDHGFDRERAFNITSRIMQGGGFLKDIIYLKGLVQLRAHLKNGGEILPLLAGKFALKHIDTIKELTERQLLKPPAIKPKYLQTDYYPKKIQQIRQGIDLSQMVTL